MILSIKEGRYRSGGTLEVQTEEFFLFLKKTYRLPWPFQIGWGRLQPISWECQQTPEGIYILIMGAFG